MKKERKFFETNLNFSGSKEMHMHVLLIYSVKYDKLNSKCEYMSLSTTVLCLILILLVHEISTDLKFHGVWMRALIEFYEHENPVHNKCFHI